MIKKQIQMQPHRGVGRQLKQLLSPRSTRIYYYYYNISARVQYPVIIYSLTPCDYIIMCIHLLFIHCTT